MIDLKAALGARTKKDRLALIRSLIDDPDHKIGVLWGAGATEMMNALTGWNKVAYRRKFNDAYPNDTRCVESSDDGVNFEVWSWRKAVETGHSLVEALRAEIKPQVDAWKLMHPFGSCVHCGSKDDLTVDHADPTFKQLFDDFLEEHGDVRLYNDGSGAGWKMDPNAEGWLWRTFHGERATYQLLCRSCNSKKGNKNAA